MACRKGAVVALTRVQSLLGTSSLLDLHLDTRMYTRNPSPQVRPRTPVVIFPCREPSVPNHPRKLRLRREFSYRLDQVLIRISVTRQNGAHQGYHRERVLIIQSTNYKEHPSEKMRHSRVQHGIAHFAKLETGEAASWFKHSVRLLKDCGNGRAIADPERDRVQVI